MVCLGEALLHLAELQGDGLVDIATKAQVLDGFPLLLEGLLDTHVGGQGLVLHLDELGSPLRRVLVRRRHGGHGISHISDLLGAEGLLVLAYGQDAVLLRQILARDDGLYARQGLGLRRVD